MMAQAKKKPAEPEVVEVPTDLTTTEPSLPAEVNAGASVLAFLNEQADEQYEPGLLQWEIGRGTNSFSTQGFGSTEDLTGIVLAAEITRGLWSFGTDEEKADIEKWTDKGPICISRGSGGANGKIGKVLDDEAPQNVKDCLGAILDTDVICKPCKWNEWGSAIGGGRGKLCKENRRLLIYNPATHVPGFLSLPPSSIGNWKKYRAGFTSKHYSNALTKMTLTVMTRPNSNDKYSVVNFMVGKDPDGNAISIEMIMELVAPLSRKVSYDGQMMSEAEAMLSEFLNLSLDKDIDYPPNGETQKGDRF